MDTIREMIISDIKELAGIDAAQLIDNGLLTFTHAKKWVVKRMYYEMSKPGRTYTDIKLELSVKYDISVSAIEKLVYRKTRKARSETAIHDW